MIGAAAVALSDVLSTQEVTTWLRRPFVEESADHKPLRPEGSGLCCALGGFVTCSRCVGSWCTLGLVGLRIAASGSGRAINAVSHVRFDAATSEMARQPRLAPSRVGRSEPSGPL